MQRRGSYLRALTVAAGIGVLAALLLIPVSAYAVEIAPDAPLLYAPIVGLWVLPVLTTMLALRRPGVGMLTSLVAGLLSLPLGGYGARALLSLVAVALVLELAVGLARYRRWGRSFFAVVLTVAVALFAALVWRGLGLDAAVPAVQVAFVVLELVSVQGALVLAAVIARVLVHSRVGRWVRANDGWVQGNEPLVTDGGWRYDGKSATKPDTTP